MSSKENKNTWDIDSDIDIYAPIYEAPVDMEVRYIITPIAGGKRLQAVILLLDSGATWIRSYRPIVDEYKFSGKRVRIKGRPYTSSPYVQTVMGRHFEVEEISLASGETPFSTIPKTIPIPPKAFTIQDLEQRVHMWVHCVGNIQKVEVESSFEDKATLLLQDGQEVSVFLSKNSFQPPEKKTELSQWVGKTVTVLGNIKKNRKGVFLQTTRIALGNIDSCPIDNIQTKTKQK
ncbi:MAG: hypothetical protein CL916_03035 [Deltaproteobacteria bacterium]|nr:hypothetical protein [Deltaproteobacteria bacterium]